MRRLAPLALLVFTLGISACATKHQNSQYGNFIQSSTLDHQKLATAAAQQLGKLYPPAHTRLKLQQATPDAFGQALVKALRERGYAVIEITPGGAASLASATTASKASAPAVAEGVTLRYVLDQAGGADLYRLTLIVGNQSITRPYLAQNGDLVPAGYWVRQE